MSILHLPADAPVPEGYRRIHRQESSRNWRGQSVALNYCLANDHDWTLARGPHARELVADGWENVAVVGESKLFIRRKP